MKREIVVEGKPYRVEVLECGVGKPCSVKLSDEPIDVELEEEPHDKNPFMVRVRGKPYVVELDKIQRQAAFQVKVNDVALRVEVKSASMKLAIPAAPATVMVQKPSKRAFEEGVVTAPMAGKIVLVRAEKGRTIRTGDVLFTLEAMKMENEITAPKNGVIEQVMVKEGQTVNEGETLAIIK